jgi:hypothetical protein
MADYTTSDAQFWRKGKSGGMVPYNHPEATDELWSEAGGATTPQATTHSGPTAGTTQPYSGGIDPGLQQVTPIATDTKPLPYAPSIPTGPAGGSPLPQATTHGGGPTGTPAPDGGARQTVSDDFGQRPPDQMQASVRQALMGLLGTDVNNVAATDADIAPQSRAYAAAVQRETQGQRAQALEEAQQEGTLSSGATTGRLGAIGMTGAQAIGANDASLIGQKQQQRIDQLKTGIAVASSMGMAQEANDLQRQLGNLQARVTQRGQDVTAAGQQMQGQLANLDAASKTYLAQLNAQLQREGYGTQERLAALDAEVRKLGINTQGNLGQLDLALRQTLGTGQLNLGLLQTLLSNNQANNALGFDIGKWSSILNSQAAGAGMGG